MPATAVFALAVVLGLFMLVVLGAAWFVAIPVAVLVFLIPVAFVAALAGRKLERNHPSGSEGVPSSAEASYDPVVDPAARRGHR
jgi:membrane protein implicated in regulation of membrane protease activity